MTLSSCCLKVGSFSKGTPQGSIEKIDGKDTYITGDRSSNAAILIVHDVFGISLVNTKVLADKYAQAVGAAVYLPDFFEGNDLVQQGMFDSPPKQIDIPAFLGKYPPREPAWEKTQQFVGEIRKLQPGAKVGAVGFCWGATSCLKLGEEGPNKVDAIAFCHPSLIEATDFAHLATPGLFICPEHDQMFPEENRNAAWEVAKSTLGPKKVFTSFVLVAGLTHGYAIKGDSDDEFTAIGMQHAANLVSAHFSMFLK